MVTNTNISQSVQTGQGSNSQGLTRMPSALGFSSPLTVIFFSRLLVVHVMIFRSLLSHEKKLLRELCMFLETLNMNSVIIAASNKPRRLVLQPSSLELLGSKRLGPTPRAQRADGGARTQTQAVGLDIFA